MNNFLKVSAKQYREMIEPKKSNKFHAVKTESDGIIFDSKKESVRYWQLVLLEKEGKIKNIQRQVRFVLQDGFVNNENKTIKPIYYVADFCYERNGVKIVEDVKSPATKTPVYKIKKKMFEYRYPEYKFVEF
jgi:hypothetical protein